MAGRKRKMAVAAIDAQIASIANEVDKRTLAIWAADCAERVLHYFEEERPDDERPRFAIATLREWIRTGNSKMSVIRGASLSTHAAARDVADHNAARSAARAAGQAVATAHVAAHSRAAAIYAATAVKDALGTEEMEAEKAWQLQRLIDLTCP
jgi:hypothetical protein